MRTWRVVAVLIALTLPAARGSAQDTKSDTAQWAVGVEVGLNAARGNSSFTTLTSGLRFSHLNRSRYEAEWASAMTYSETRSTVLARRIVTGLKLDLIPQAVWSPFLFTSVERDRIRRLNLLTSNGAGVKYTFYRTAITALSLSAAALYVNKDVMPGASITIGGEPKASTARLSLRPKIVRKVPLGFSFEQISFWQPVFGQIGDYNLESGSRVGYAVSKSSTFFLQHTYRFDSRPPIGVKREDQLLVAGIRAQF